MELVSNLEYQDMRDVSSVSFSYRVYHQKANLPYSSIMGFNFKDSCWEILFVVFFLICLAESKTHYLAAVVEYQPEGTPWDFTPVELINKNAANYMKLIQEASLQNADVVVFPEYGLTTLGIPRSREEAKPFLLAIPDVGINPCDTKTGSLIIQEFSCLTQQSNIYVVINVGEIRPCNSSYGSCPNDGVFQFNTNVAFDRRGTIISKYEKANLYFEDQFDKPDPIQLSTFTTDFGVEFGLFTCFDIIFYNPAVKLVENGLRNFIFPTAWVDEVPFLTAIQAQASWAHSCDVNLLASGYHQPIGGQLGSGIYAGRFGSLNYTFDPDSGTKIIFAEVPINSIDSNYIYKTDKNPLKKELPSKESKAYHSFLREDLQNYTSQILEFTNSTGDYLICTENNFCCVLEYELSESIDIPMNYSERYRLIAFNGTRTVASKTAQYDWQVCGIVRCLNETIESCSENAKVSIDLLPKFKILSLKSTFDLDRTRSHIPGYNFLDTKMNLIPFHFFHGEINNNNTMQIYSTNLTSIDIKTIVMIYKLYDYE